MIGPYKQTDNDHLVSVSSNREANKVSEDFVLSQRLWIHTHMTVHSETTKMILFFVAKLHWKTMSWQSIK